MRILVVEDEKRIASDIANALRAESYLVEVCHDGEQAWFRADTESFDAVVLDLGLPGIDGLAVLRRWREAANDTPVVILTARDTWQERIIGIDSGADDYLTKPFRIEELLARLRAVLRRKSGKRSPRLQAGSLELDTRNQTVSVSGQVVTLSTLEYRTLAYLLYHKGRLVPRSELLEHVYGDADTRDPNALDALVSRLRRKIRTDVIETRRGHGYVIEESER